MAKTTTKSSTKTNTGLPAKKVAESHTVMTELIMPNDTNPMNQLMGAI